MTGAALHLVAVCTHNRTRSVMMGAFLRAHLADHGTSAVVSTAGFADAELLPTSQTVRALAERGIDVSRHRSSRLDAALVARADLIVVAERQHVIWLCADAPDIFDRCFTLPEVVLRAAGAGPRAGRSLPEWLDEVGAGRRRTDYVDGMVPELADPTGASASVFSAAVAEIDGQCRRLAELMKG